MNFQRDLINHYIKCFVASFFSLFHPMILSLCSFSFQTHWLQHTISVVSEQTCIPLHFKSKGYQVNVGLFGCCVCIALFHRNPIPLQFHYLLTLRSRIQMHGKPCHLAMQSLRLEIKMCWNVVMIKPKMNSYVYNVNEI